MGPQLGDLLAPGVPVPIELTTTPLTAARYGVASDVYSFGMTIFEAAYRHWAFQEVNQLQFIMMFHLNQMRPELPPPRSVSAPTAENALIVEILISSCWQPAPDNRPTMARVVDTLLELEQRELERPSSPAPMPVTQPPVVLPSGRGRAPKGFWSKLRSVGDARTHSGAHR